MKSAAGPSTRKGAAAVPRLGAQCAHRHQHRGCGARRQDGDHHAPRRSRRRARPGPAPRRTAARPAGGRPHGWPSCPRRRRGSARRTPEEGVHVGDLTRRPEVLVGLPSTREMPWVPSMNASASSHARPTTYAASSRRRQGSRAASRRRTSRRAARARRAGPVPGPNDSAPQPVQRRDPAGRVPRCAGGDLPVQPVGAPNATTRSTTAESRARARRRGTAGRRHGPDPRCVIP